MARFKVLFLLFGFYKVILNIIKKLKLDKRTQILGEEKYFKKGGLEKKVLDILFTYYFRWMFFVGQSIVPKKSMQN